MPAVNFLSPALELGTAEEAVSLFRLKVGVATAGGVAAGGSLASFPAVVRASLSSSVLKPERVVSSS